MLGTEDDEMRAAGLQELWEMAAKLLATACELPPGQHRHNALREIGRFRAQIAALHGDEGELMPARPSHIHHTRDERDTGAVLGTTASGQQRDHCRCWQRAGLKGAQTVGW
jgi:hypothetical protein